MSFFGASNSAGFGRQGEDVERLFQADPTSTVPVSIATSYQPASSGSPSGARQGFGSGSSNTLDEPIWETAKRDLKRIYKNLVMVVFPFKDRSQQSAALRNWDLWGPMVFTLGLAVILSLSAAKASSTFSLVFALVSVGAIVLTVNVVLLGGTIGFFQSLCLLGYCIFPLVVSALVGLFVTLRLVRWIIVPVAIVWSSWASVPFIGGAVPVNRRALAVYPLLLLYSTLGWLQLIA